MYSRELNATQLYSIKISVVNEAIILVFSAAALFIHRYLNKRETCPTLIKLTMIVAVYIIFYTFFQLWQYFTVNYCQPVAYAITFNRFINITLTVISLIYSIIPATYFCKRYSTNQTSITIVIWILSLYVYSFFHAWYFKLFFK
jgi:hypothetical protein